MQQQHGPIINSRKQFLLRGSTKIIVEFFEYCVNSLLFQRGLYAAEHFKMTKKYGLHMLVTIDPAVKEHMANILKQVEEWLMVSKVEKLILAVKSKETMAVLERWQFDIRNEKDDPSYTDNGASPLGTRASAPPKTEQQIQDEIQAIMRQITACVTFLPMLNGKCTWTILCQTARDAEVPTTWSDADPHLIQNPEQVKLRSFSTNMHRVDAMVAYRLRDDY
ncbi:hypothetical protein BGZ93_003381 [Podila epicladia]|nr:hypothetical protein BGZ92_001981 [Podila epicladia]KAG0100211.1 hypothetical protein BGZ93_003381 [Podila epicladia]